MKHVVACATSLVIAAGATANAFAQTYPNKIMRMVVGFTAGGPSDFIARTISQKLTEMTGQVVVVENRAGANGMVAADFTLKSPPDGHTIFMSSSGLLTFQSHLYPSNPFDPFKEFAAVTGSVAVPEILVVHPALPVSSVKELIAFAKARPNQITYASTGAGGMPHLAMESFNAATGVKSLHVPYKGAAQAVTDVMGGQVHITFLDIPVLMAQIKAGKLKALAIATDKRAAVLPDIPTMREAGFPSVNADNWYGMVVSAATPKDIVARANELLVKAIMAPEIRERLAAQGINPLGGTQEEFLAFWRKEHDKWGKIIKDAGIKVE